jgi:UDP-N-acetylmuramoylalanine--D-glutamate ligase
VGDAAHPWFADADLVVPSPAIPPRAWPSRHPPVLSPEGLFFMAHRGPRLAVTGTKGKSTTARIVGALLGWEVAGNSYEPLLASLERHDSGFPVVCELSSFQLWYLREQRPAFSAAIITNLGRDHLDWHPDLAHYHAAKLALAAWSAATAVHDDLAPLLPAGALRLAPKDQWSGLWQSSDLGLLGDHNRSNASLAVAAALQLGCAPSAVAPRLRTVMALPHRLQTVHQRGGLRFVDDSIATTPESAMAGMASITGPMAVILGGSDKGATWDALAAAVVRRGAMAVVIGSTGPAIATAITQAGGNPQRAADLTAAVRMAAASLAGAGTVLLSPACASLDMFRGFEHRGDCFRDAAQAICP